EAIHLARNIQGQGRSGLPPGITNTEGWTEEQVRGRLEEVKAQLDWGNPEANARQWWDAFEGESRRHLAFVLRLAEELANRKTAVTGLIEAYERSNTNNIQAVLHYLDYSLMKQAEAGETEQTGRYGEWWMKPAPGMTRVKGWPEDQIRQLLEKVKAKIGWQNTGDPDQRWWQEFEQENRHRLPLVLRLAEELAERRSTIAEFYRSMSLSEVKDIRANLHYLDYNRLTKEEFEYQTVVLDETGKTVGRSQRKTRRFIEELAPGVLLEMVEIPGGTFKMGISDEDVEEIIVEEIIEEVLRHGARREDAGKWVSRERPQHEVVIPAFYIGKFTITQRQWKIIAGWEKIENDLDPDPSHFKGPERP